MIDRLGPFDLDPCQCDPQPWLCAAAGFTEADDGLRKPWSGLVYCNPPYGAALGQWLQRCSQHGNAVALVFARTETRAFFAHVWPSASRLLFLNGRIAFHRPDGTIPKRAGGKSGGPSVLIAWGEAAAMRLDAAADIGQIVDPVRAGKVIA